MILRRYYEQTANTRALNKSIDGPAVQPAENTPNSDRLGVYHQTVHGLTVQVYRRPRPPIWQKLGLNLDLDPKWRSGTVTKTSSIGTHFQDGAESVSLLWLPLKAANALYMDGCNKSPLWLPKMQIHKSLMLRWHSFTGWCSYHVSLSDFYRGFQKVGYAKQRPNHISITVLSRPIIIDTPLILIFINCSFTICCHQEFLSEWFELIVWLSAWSRLACWQSRAQ